jgi:hypothetical protein
MTEVMVKGPSRSTNTSSGRIERVPDRLFEGEEPVLHLMGDQIRETKRRMRSLHGSTHRPPRGSPDRQLEFASGDGLLRRRGSRSRGVDSTGGV